jgi:hypothetical protein
MSDGSGEIIIKGSSCQIYFDHDVFQRDETDVKKRSTTLNIKQIIISGDQQFADYNSGEHPTKFTGTIKVICG